LKQKIRVWVINLESRPDRLQKIGKQLNLMGVNWTRLDAVDGRKCDENTLSISTKYGEIGALNDGVRGCTASHYKFWQEFYSTGEDFGIVLEDDVKLSNDFFELISDTSWIPNNTKLIKLEKFAANRPSKLLLGKVLSNVLNDSREVRRMYSRHCGTGAYLISKNGAKIALNWKNKFSVPIDHVLFNETVSRLSSNLTPFILVPAIAWQSNDIGQGSDIYAFSSETLSNFKKQLRSIKRGYYEARLWPYQLIMLMVGRAKIIKVIKK